jgi:hypothetical protein
MNQSDFLSCVVEENSSQLETTTEAPVVVNGWKLVPQLPNCKLNLSVAAGLCSQVFNMLTRYYLYKVEKGVQFFFGPENIGRISKKVTSIWQKHTNLLNWLSCLVALVPPEHTVEHFRLEQIPAPCGALKAHSAIVVDLLAACILFKVLERRVLAGDLDGVSKCTEML